MKDVLPPEAKVSKHAKEVIQECATEFIGFVTGEASERCRRERRKTVNGDDICHAMTTLGLDNYAGSRSPAPPPPGDGMIQIDVWGELSNSRGNEKHGRD
ncbi:unnamed protein product [Triticum turgidum subsp. durum]|uniref:Transcription factor CBF/NF-Y/archaeal histone domain-containing protein n=1 Tax=Triticum turgidum subsp. durum TaxID=4567 RepID=A0A9R0RX66_TRITD|nr:unnamed protein product [Triticum turgidum subsp. durum]